MTELTFMSASDLSRLLETGEISPLDIALALLQRIDRFDNQLRSYITVCRDAAIDAARHAEREIRVGRRRGLLHGIPVAHKDVVWTKGVRTTAHSQAMMDFVPTQDATYVRKLAEAGMILIGKTNTGEFACGTTDIFGTPRNPWALTHYTGGSSNGSANAVASGLAITATGTDTGGSVRVPASLCGVVGLKPTYGRISRHGVIPLSWTMDHVGTLTRTVLDAAIMLRGMAGYDEQDPTSSRLPVPDYVAALQAPVAGLTIGVPIEHFYNNLHREVESAICSALVHLEQLGIRLVHVSVPHATELEAAAPLMYRAEAFAQHASRLRQRPADYGRRARQKIASGAFFTAAEYLQSAQIRTLWRRDLRRVFANIDALVTPTLPFPAFTLTVQNAGPPDTSWGTRHFNMSGHPAITIPCGFTADGLPIGMQLVAKHFDETMILRIAHAFEQTTEWHKKRPKLGEEEVHVRNAGMA